MSIAPFIESSAIPFVICSICKYAVVANEVRGHLIRNHTTPPDEAAVIQQNAQSIDGIIKSQAESKRWEWPAPTVKAVPELEEPKDDGFRCHRCRYISRAVRKMQAHCRRKHGWVNDWAQGGDVRLRVRLPRQAPWETGVRCQRLGRTRHANQWFEVERPTEGAPDEEDSLSSKEMNMSALRVKLQYEWRGVSVQRLRKNKMG